MPILQNICNVFQTHSFSYFLQLKFEVTISIFRFQGALVEYGVDEADIFQTNDLFEKKDLANVTNTIFALGRAVSYQIVALAMSRFNLSLILD